MSDIYTERQLVPLNMLLGHFAMWSVRQSPYPCPDNLEKVLGWLYERLAPEMTDGIAGCRMCYFASCREFEDWLKQRANFYWVANWNKPKSGHQQEYVFSSRYDSPAPDGDFIDLDALHRNVARSVWRECSND